MADTQILWARRQFKTKELQNQNAITDQLQKHFNTSQLNMDVTVCQEVNRRKINSVFHSPGNFCPISSKCLWWEYENIDPKIQIGVHVTTILSLEVQRHFYRTVKLFSPNTFSTKMLLCFARGTVWPGKGNNTHLADRYRALALSCEVVPVLVPRAVELWSALDPTLMGGCASYILC